MDRSLRDRLVPPAWLRDTFEWGPSTWPVYWCEAAQADSIDCGVFAALARTLLTARGTPTAAVQLVERFNEKNVENWRSRWTGESAEVGWLSPPFCYHEAVGLIDDNNLNIWDPLDRKRVVPHPTGGYGEIAFLRISKLKIYKNIETITWETIEIDLEKWIEYTDI